MLNIIFLCNADLYLYNVELLLDSISSGEVLWDYIPCCSLRNLLKLGGGVAESQKVPSLHHRFPIIFCYTTVEKELEHSDTL